MQNENENLDSCGVWELGVWGPNNWEGGKYPRGLGVESAWGLKVIM